MKTNYFAYDSNKLNLYSVVVKAGHGDMGNKGQNYYIPIEHAILAPDGKAAAEKARWLPRTKHHDLYAVLSVKAINQEEFNEIKKKNDEDWFFKCSSVQQQRMMIGDMKDRVVWEEEAKQHNKKANSTGKIKFHKKSKIKNPKKFAKYYEDYTYDDHKTS